MNRQLQILYQRMRHNKRRADVSRIRHSHVSKGKGMGITRGIGLLVVMGIIAVFLMGCAESTVRDSQTFIPHYRDPGIIAAVPFLPYYLDRPDQRLVRPPGFEGFITVGEIAPEGAQTITSLFTKKLIGSGYNFVSREMVVKTLPSAESLEEKPEDLAQRLALQLRSDSVLIGWVFRYRERIGNAWGARQPASVAFVALLFNGRDGELMWRGRFDETQKPLSEDILALSSFMRRGGRWVTARELAADGVNRVLLTFPGEKKAGVER